MTWSQPFVTEYESQYGPPQFAHDPMEITYLGSGIWSYTRLSGAAILSVTVPATTRRSAWRGDAGNGMTPKRMMSNLLAIAAPISMPQQANPNCIIHNEYLRLQLSSHETGPGSLTFSITAIRASSF